MDLRHAHKFLMGLYFEGDQISVSTKKKSFKGMKLSSQVLVIFLMSFDTLKALRPENKEVALNTVFLRFQLHRKKKKAKMNIATPNKTLHCMFLSFSCAKDQKIHRVICQDGEPSTLILFHLN